MTSEQTLIDEQLENLFERVAFEALQTYSGPVGNSDEECFKHDQKIDELNIRIEAFAEALAFLGFRNETDPVEIESYIWERANEIDDIKECL